MMIDISGIKFLAWVFVRGMQGEKLRPHFLSGSSKKGALYENQLDKAISNSDFFCIRKKFNKSTPSSQR